MKNFSTKYPVNGSSALEPDINHYDLEKTSIIEFPNKSYDGNIDACSSMELGHTSNPASLIPQRVTSLKDGIDSIAGIPFNRVKPWQAVAVGILFASATYIGLFLPF